MHSVKTADEKSFKGLAKVNYKFNYKGMQFKNWRIYFFFNLTQQPHKWVDHPTGGEYV